MFWTEGTFNHWRKIKSTCTHSYSMCYISSCQINLYSRCSTCWVNAAFSSISWITSDFYVRDSKSHPALNSYWSICVSFSFSGGVVSSAPENLLGEEGMWCSDDTPRQRTLPGLMVASWPLSCWLFLCGVKPPWRGGLYSVASVLRVSVLPRLFFLCSSLQSLSFS